MKINLNIKYILGIVPLLVVSCTSLDEEPVSNQVTTQFYTDQSEAISAVNGVYSALLFGGDDQTLYNRGIQVATEISTDDYIAGPRAINTNVRALAALSHDAANDRMEAIWEDSYKLINAANIVIDKVPLIASDKISESIRQRSINEAKFLRALAYFNLVRWFKYIPLVLHETTSLSEDKLYVEQADEDDVYAQIIQDLKDAENLPEPTVYANEDIGRATSGAAKSLLAKVYLTREQWQLAASKAQEVINSGWYDLFENFSDVFNPQTKNGKEHIFSLQHKGYTSGSRHQLAGCEATYEVPGINGSYADAYNTNSDLYASYAKNDRRLPVTLITEQVSPQDNKTYTLSAPVFNKYYDNSVVGAQIQSSVNFPVIRYAEVLLIYAEALNELNGPTEVAYEYLDKIRSRAGISKLAESAPNLSKEAFRDSLFEERRKEFTYEYQRWFDLSRRGADYMIKKLKAAGKTNVASRHIHFPIPQRELDLNPKLKQNPDWENY